MKKEKDCIENQKRYESVKTFISFFEFWYIFKNYDCNKIIFKKEKSHIAVTQGGKSL